MLGESLNRNGAVDMWYETFPDWVNDQVELFEKKGRYAARLRVNGVHLIALKNLPLAGKKVISVTTAVC